jgi:hypothetical protein
MPEARQLDLVALFAGPTTIEERFRDFHERNPGVYSTLVRLAREAKAAGYTRIGIAMLYEVCRWQMLLGSDPNEDYKLNNDYRSHYARLIMANEPDLDGIFETRRLVAV